jgi:hypothetical protein
MKEIIPLNFKELPPLLYDECNTPHLMRHRGNQKRCSEAVMIPNRSQMCVP